MRVSRSPLAVAAVLLALALPARAAGVAAIHLGDTVSGTVDAGVLEVIPFDAAEGTLLDLDFKMAAGSSPSLSVLQPDRSTLAGLAAYSSVDSKASIFKVRKAPLEQTGRHFLLLSPSQPGAYKLALKGKPPTKAIFTGFVSPVPPVTVTIGSIPGAHLTITAKATKGSFVSPKVLFVNGPGSLPVDLGTATSHSLTSFKDVYKGLPLPSLGDYTVGVGTTTGLQGDLGEVQLVLSLPRFKKAKVADGDLVVNPYVDAVLPTGGFDNLPYTGVQLTGQFLRPGASVRLEGAVNLDATSVIRQDDQHLAFDVDLTGAPTGPYDVVVNYPNGATGRMPVGFQVLPTPIPTSISPSLGFDGGTQSFTVTGTRFQTGLSVAVRPTGDVSTIVGTVSPGSTATQAVVSLPLLDVILTTYDVIVTNPDGGTRTLAGALTVQRGPRFTAAVPLIGFDNQAALPVALTGNYFQAGMACTLELTGQTSIPSVVTGLTATTATATFDLRGKLAGAWTLRVTNTDGGTATLPSTFALTRAPRPGAVTGGRLVDGFPATGLVLAGTDFKSGAQVTFEQTGSTTLSATAEAVNVPGTQITFDANPTGIPIGLQDVRATNPDGGTDISPGGAVVLGLRTITTSGTTAGRPAVAYDAEDDQYLAVYSVFDGTQWDVRGQRFSALTGIAVGSEISITSVANDSSGTVDQTAPCVVYSPSIHLWFVAYAWKDVNASGNKVKVLSQFVNRDGTLNTTQANAFTAFTASSGSLDGPRVAWNSTREQWVVVYAFDTAQIPSVQFTAIGKGSVVAGAQVPTLVSSGVLISDAHQITSGGLPAVQTDKDFEPDIAWSPTQDLYAVSCTLDVVEAGDSPPADSGTNVVLDVFQGDFSTGGHFQYNPLAVGNVNNKNERRSRLATSGNTFLVTWDFASGASNRDVRCWLVDAVAGTTIGGSPTTVEQTAATDAASPAVAFDASASGSGYVVVYPLVPSVSGTSSIIATRFPLNAGPALGTAVHQTLGAATTNVTYDAGAAAVRSIGNEFLGGWMVSGSAKSPVTVEGKFSR